jgi:hypothetical protein
MSYSGGGRAESEVTTTVGAPESSHSGGTVVRDYAKTSASGSNRRSLEDGPSDLDDAECSPPERVPSPSFTNESRSSSPSPSAKQIEDEGPTDFSHPAAAEEQRIIWLPKDHLGLVNEAERDLDAHGVLYSTEGAEMDNNGHVNVTMAPPEDVQRSLSGAVPLPSPADERVDGMQATSKRLGSSKV